MDCKTTNASKFELTLKAREHHKLDFTQIAKKPKDNKIKKQPKKTPKKTKPAKPIPDDNIIVAAASEQVFLYQTKVLL